MNPYKIDGPAIVSFSGGRTSGYMLFHILKQHQGQLSKDVHVVFCNTGKEMPETLDFVRDCENNWGIEINWLEYKRKGDEHDYIHTNYATAARNGEPFEQMLETTKRKRDKKQLKGTPLPNPRARICTKWLKINLMRKFMLNKGYKQWESVIGLRYDEPRRVAKQKADQTKNRTKNIPLYEDGVTKEDVGVFWRNNNFDLKLPNVNGETPHGNCDLCFLKSLKKTQYLIKEKPSRADWWIAIENKYDNIFRIDRPPYIELQKISQLQADLFDDFEDEELDCFCHD